MFFYELIYTIDAEKCAELYLEFYGKSRNIKKIKAIKAKILRAIESLKKIKPNKNEEFVINVIQEEENEKKERYDRAILLKKGETNEYGFELSPWSDILGFLVENNHEQYENEYFVALVLWEMTWLGFDEKEIQEHAKRWQ